MIEVTIFTGPNGVYGFQISGHSDYAKDGQEDILCAAVSTLSENTVNSVEAFTKDRVRTLSVNEEEGFMHFTLMEVSDASRLLLDSFILGMKNLKESYGQFIEIRFMEEK